MKNFYYFLVLILILKATTALNELEKRDKADARQMEYISLINSLLQQTNLLSSFDGVLLALTTILASSITKIKPLLIATALSYIIYVATAILIPGPLSQLGLPTMENADPKLMARSADSSETKVFDNIMAETLMRSIQISPVMSIMTNVSVNVITETMARVRIMSRMFVQQMSVLQRSMLRVSRMLSNECVARFLCRVGQFTEVNFPIASTMLRSLANSSPGMDEYVVAVVRGTSSSNCSLIYPDCTT
ncbi:uncharacterized protein LOC118186716 [Stegodyphus dumicola]|uniref:uncharacterized protein LOC118186716 n=1 Tax=Stegodyphus dumicola TaxID=202533 RepID=UPI0015AD8052|nr:uncharacterized protein LOC118186716 [Stegodyphus dumicola]